MAETRKVNFYEEVMDYHDEVAQQGYEGVIIRARDAKYIQKRSLSMRKYKNFLDSEYPIIDVKKDEGVEDKYFVWVLHDPDLIDPKTGSPKIFYAKPTGSDEDRESWYENYLEYIGKMMKVKYQELTEDGVPRFPIALGIREDQ
jgi:DNA ligase-1